MSDRKVVIMEIFYTKQGMPVMVVDGVAYNFNSPDKGEILAQLSMNPEVIAEIKNEIIEYMKTVRWENFAMESESYSNMKTFISYASDLHLFTHVISVLEDAQSTSEMLAHPQPYPSWFWNGVDKGWLPPFPYPENVPEGIYMWDESTTSWIPSEQQPHPSWSWSPLTLRYEPPIAYPADAPDGQFVWNEQTRSWVLNDKMG